VYDITDFVDNHPGGSSKIMLAAGQKLEPFWRLYQQHFRTSAPMDLLEKMKVGELHDSELEEDEDEEDDKDPYDADPERHPGLLFHNNKPCNAELPPTMQLQAWKTPNPHWFIRHHHPVPQMGNGSEWRLSIEGPASTARDSPRTSWASIPRKCSQAARCEDSLSATALSLEDLRANFRLSSVTCTIQCGGNRRSGLDKLEKTSGIGWGTGAVSNAEFTGVPLADVLKSVGLGDPEACRRKNVKHVQFQAADGMQSSIPIESALDLFGNVLLAYEMNGEPLPAEHGFPCRVVVPGHVGVRNVKWVTNIVASSEEAEGPWQRGIAYKGFAPGVKSFEGVDVEAVQSMQKTPVQSVIVSPSEGQELKELVKPGAENGGVTATIPVEGWAYSGGGNGIVRVDVSCDQGATWHTATLTEGKDQPPHRAYAWTFWKCNLPVPAGTEEVELCCKATDASYNVQPEFPESIWNARGLNNTSWHRVKVKMNQ
jgi:sulfite oxidase